MLVAIALVWGLAGNWLESGTVGLVQVEPPARAAALTVQSISMASLSSPDLASKGAKGAQLPDAPGTAAGTGFTYQGNLVDNNVPANGQYDFAFNLFDAPTGGVQAAAPVTVTNQTVSSGLFTVSLDFGGAFYGQARWLEIAVRATGGGSFTTLAPRQFVTAAPFALSSRWEATSNKPFPFNPLRQANTFSTVDSEGTVGRDTAVTIGADGLGLVSYSDSTNHQLKVAHCSNAACSSASTATIDSTTSNGVGTSITIGADGLGLISYFDGTTRHLKVAHCNDAACSSATSAIIDPSNDNGQHSSITIGADGLGLVSYVDNYNGHLKVAHCTNTACSSATTATIDPGTWTGTYTSITLGADGLGLVAYLDNGSIGVLKVAHCSNTACSSATTAIADGSGGVGWNPSITLGADGLGLISYLDETNGNLKVAHCNDVACTSATSATVDSAGFVGQYGSISMGADGLGLIAYLDGTSTGVLKVAHCSNTACTSANASALDTVGDTDSISVATGADGLGLITYWHNPDGVLKAVHCAGPNCVSYQTSRR
jgi:hypothetical protein